MSPPRNDPRRYSPTTPPMTTNSAMIAANNAAVRSTVPIAIVLLRRKTRGHYKSAPSPRTSGPRGAKCRRADGVGWWTPTDTSLA
jgi:hypothetical protein